MSPLRRELRQTSYTHEESLGPAKLFLDDLDDLMKLLREASEERRREYVSELHERKRSEPGQRETGEGGNREADGITRTAKADPDSKELRGAAERAIVDGRKAVDDWFARRFRVELKVGDAVADEPDDLRHAPRKDLSRVRISVMDIQLWVTLGPHYAKISAHVYQDDNLFARKLVDDTVRLINRRRLHIVLTWATALYLLGGGVFFALGALSAVNGDLAGGAPLVATGAILAVVPQFMLRRSGSVTIVPRRYSEARGLSDQNRREVFVAIVSAAIGAILGTIGTIVTNLIMGGN